MNERSKSLAEACTPAFMYLTGFRRNSATSKLSIDEVHGALQRELDALRRRCDEDRKLRPLLDRSFYALVAAADQVVLSSAWPQRTGWSMRLLEMHYFKSRKGGTQFFRFVDEILNDPSEEAAEIAEVLFTCMALGFQGELLGEPRELERRRRQLYEKARLPGLLGETLTPDAYGRTVGGRMAKLPTVATLRLLLIGLGAIVFLVVIATSTTFFLSKEAKNRVDEVIQALEQAAPKEPPR